MKKITFVALFAVVFALAAVAEASAQKKFSSVVTDPGRWSAMDVASDVDCAAGPEECAVVMLSKLSVSVGETPEFSVYELGETDGKLVTVVFVSHLPGDDGEVLGNLYRLEMVRDGADDASFSLNALGQLFQCMEGEAGWRKSPCEV